MKRWGLALKVACLASAWWLLTLRIPMRDLAAAFRAVRSADMGVVVALSIPWFLLRLSKWSLVLQAFQLTLPVRQRAASLCLGVVAGSVTPLQAGEALRCIPVEGPKRRVILCTLVDKAIDVLGLLLVVGIVGMGEATGVVLGAPLVPRARARSLALALLTALASYGVVLLQYHLLIASFAPRYDRRLLRWLPLLMATRLLPFTFGGLGVREHLAASIFPRFGVGPAPAAAVALLMFAANILLPLVGMTSWFLSRPRTRSQERAARGAAG